MGCFVDSWPPLWSSGQSSWLQIQRSRARFPVLPDFLRISVAGTWSAEPLEDNWGATWKDSSGSGLKPKLMAVGIRCADHATTLSVKLPLTSPTNGGRSVGTVRWRTEAPEFFFVDNYRNFVGTWSLSLLVTSPKTVTLSISFPAEHSVCGDMRIQLNITTHFHFHHS
jgi:hypothetical protein